MQRSRSQTDEDGHDAVLERMIAGAREIVGLAEPDQVIRAIGVAAPGVLDMDGGYTIFRRIFRNWPMVPVGPRMTEALGLPVYLINDVRCSRSPNSKSAPRKSANRFAMQSAPESVAGSWHGRVNMGLGGAGKLGHMVVNTNGPCGCGNRGCAEAYAAGPAIIGEAANRLIVMGETTTLREMIGDDLNKMTPELVSGPQPTAIHIARRVNSTTLGFT
ncbi:MAG: ROK family protein [Thermomicrobiales bacterium]|nr:ROK family protein [Thermomicrobiales bacterium]